MHILGLVAGVVLPSEIGTSEHRRIAEKFSAWLAGYDPNTEPKQQSTYDYTPNLGLAPYPRSRIDDDLGEIESLSRQQFSRSFENLELVEQQILLRALVAQRPAGTVRGWIFRQDGHVVLSLLDFYYHFAMVHGSRRKK